MRMRTVFILLLIVALLMFVFLGGIRLGARGLVISAMNSWYVFLKYAKLWEITR